MLITWLISITIVAILFLVATGVFAALSVNSIANKNSSSANSYASWSVGIGILGILVLIILLIVYAVKASNRAAGVFGIGILAILFLLGAVLLAVFAIRGTTSPVADFPLWATVVSFVGALVILIFAIIYTYINWFEIAEDFYKNSAEYLERFAKQQTIAERKIGTYSREAGYIPAPPKEPAKGMISKEAARRYLGLEPEVPKVEEQPLARRARAARVAPELWGG